jgi:hypothetical protein
VANKLLRLARIAIKADVYGNLIGTIAQKAVAGAANLIAHRIRRRMPDTGFVLRGEGTPTRGNGRRAGVAQSVAQLSCN